jgi:hypothetical protein
MHPWHDVALGDDTSQSFRAVIEIPKGSKVKYDLDDDPLDDLVLGQEALVPLAIVRARAIGVITMRDDKGPTTRSSLFTSMIRNIRTIATLQRGAGDARPRGGEPRHPYGGPSVPRQGPAGPLVERDRTVTVSAIVVGS